MVIASGSSAISVVTAAIVDKSTRRILLAQRSDLATYPRTWGTPGGKVGLLERFRDALDRELDEEIHVRIVNWSHVAIVSMRRVYSEQAAHTFDAWCFYVPHHAIAGTPKCGDKTSAVRWCSANDVMTASLTPADDARRGLLASMLY